MIHDGKSPKNKHAPVAMETEPSNIKVVGPRESRTVFVSNLSEEVTEEELREKFSEVTLNSIVKSLLMVSVSTLQLGEIVFYGYVLIKRVSSLVD